MNLYYELSDHYAEKNNCTKYWVDLSPNYMYHSMYMRMSDRIWKESEIGLEIIKNRFNLVEDKFDVDKEEFLWIKLQSSPIPKSGAR